MKRKYIALPSIALTLAIIVSISWINFAAGSKNADLFTEEKSKEVAREFTKNSPTYSFDGYNLEYKETLYPEIADCPNCWTFVFKFTSSHGGYGDRTGKMLTQVITPHEAHITVKDGKVTSAVLDLEWDMLKQKTL